MKQHSLSQPSYGYLHVYLLIFLNGLCLSTASANNAFEEYEIKAVYLLNFASFVFWSASGNNFNICILGEDPFGKNLDITVETEKIAEQAVVVRRMQTFQAAEQCQILFISEAFNGSLRELLAPLKQVLTVSDRTDFIAQGGMVQFINSQDNQVRFKIVPHLLEKAGLRISTDLLEIAEVVK